MPEFYMITAQTIFSSGIWGAFAPMHSCLLRLWCEELAQSCYLIATRTGVELINT